MDPPGNAGGSVTSMLEHQTHRSDPSNATLRGTPAAPLGLLDYLQKILTARVYDVAVESPLEVGDGRPDVYGSRFCRGRHDG
jgi:threonine dehydratase